MRIEKEKNEFMNSCSKPFNQTGESIQLSVVSALAFFFPQKFNLGYLLAVKETWHRRQKKNVLESLIKFEKVQLTQSKKPLF